LNDRCPQQNAHGSTKSRNRRNFVNHSWHPKCKIDTNGEVSMNTRENTHPLEDLTLRARAEFREMPGMCLTTAQAARLWQLSPARAEELLSELVQAGFLVRRDGQRYRLPSSV
jgi:hypothetical protein